MGLGGGERRAGRAGGAGERAASRAGDGARRVGPACGPSPTHLAVAPRTGMGMSDHTRRRARHRSGARSRPDAKLHRHATPAGAIPPRAKSHRLRGCIQSFLANCRRLRRRWRGCADGACCCADCRRRNDPQGMHQQALIASICRILPRKGTDCRQGENVTNSGAIAQSISEAPCEQRVACL